MVAISLKEIVPLQSLAAVMRITALSGLAEDVRGHQSHSESLYEDVLNLWPTAAQMLDRVIHYDPTTARYLIGETVCDSKDETDILAKVVDYGFAQALVLDGSLDQESIQAFRERSLYPGAYKS